ncbi:tetratricopeptide repeat protein, partial [Massilia eurypsychrophila]
MANREALSIIRAARAGQADGQLALGKLYLFGSAGLPLSLPTALHWLERAAQQGSAEACALIGENIPYELARRSDRPLAQWYQRASDAGVARAGLVLAQLVLGDGAGADAAAAGPAGRASRPCGSTRSVSLSMPRMPWASSARCASSSSRARRRVSWFGTVNPFLSCVACT